MKTPNNPDGVSLSESEAIRIDSLSRTLLDTAMHEAAGLSDDRDPDVIVALAASILSHAMGKMVAILAGDDAGPEALAGAVRTASETVAASAVFSLVENRRSRTAPPGATQH